ncbi:MAG: C40 family peptidase [Chloroflexi bacterium]|nr:C40 family peptidase [Chloroflexota bacterium]
MLTGELLDGGGKGLVQAVGGAAAITLVLLGTAVVVPVVVLAGLLHLVALPPMSLPSISSMTSPSVLAPPLVTDGLPGVPAGSNLPAPVGVPAVDTAQRYLGVPYVFGGTNPAVGLDCSGLVQLVFRQLGIALPRTAQMQYDATVRVSRADLQPGDLVFFARTYADPNDWITHVGIYIGDGLQINAPTEGQKVSIQPVFTGFWGDHFAGGGRVKHG